MRNFVQFVYQYTGIQLSSKQAQAFQRYEQLLLEWSQHTNLTAITQPEMIRIKHFLDSLTCLPVMRDKPMNRIVDVGSGAGFPGLPLKIVCPALELTIIESVGKKINFCRAVVEDLGLTGVTLLAERAEIIAHDPRHRQQYDWAVARAVAGLPTLAEYLLPLVRVGGSVLAMKGENAPAEAQQAEQAIHLLGGQLRVLIPIILPKVAEDRYLVVIDKIAATPNRFPRRPGIPEKRPLP